jgi:hypothetical protein
VAIYAAEKQAADLRTQAARVVAHRTAVAAELEDAAAELEKASELAKQDLLKADQAAKAGNADEASRLTSSTRVHAMKMQAAEETIERLKELTRVVRSPTGSSLISPEIPESFSSSSSTVIASLPASIRPRGPTSPRALVRGARTRS